MQTTQPSLFARHDTILGACEGAGQDLGFNAQYLRIALAGLFFFNPAVALGAYAMIAVAVFVSRRLWPVATRPVEASAVVTPLHRADDTRPDELAAAA
jgi:phage shock protein C